MRGGRTICAITAAAFLLASAATSATFISDALRDLQAYLQAASRLLIQASIGLDQADIAAIPRAQRNAAKAELATLTNHLQELYIGQSSLVRNLDFYVSIAKDKARTDEEKANYWKTVVLPKIGGIRRSISKVRDFIVRTDLVVMTMTAEDMMLLRDNLRTRAIVVEKMEELPPPVAAPDLLEVEGIIVDYKALVENLLKLRKSIEETLRKLDRG